MKVVVADSQLDRGRTIAERLRKSGHDVVGVRAGSGIFQRLDQEAVDIVFCAVDLTDLPADVVLDRIRMRTPGTDVIFTASEASTSDAVAAIKRGATNFLVHPIPDEALEEELSLRAERRAVEQQYAAARKTTSLPVDRVAMVGRSEAMLRLLERLERISRSEAPVLIKGESGTGKELVARWLHQRGPRAGGPFVAVNCAALPDTLLEAELFGHDRGAYTGALKSRKGRFQMAHKGTLFLDEVAEISPTAQAKLLRVLQEGEIEPLGSSEVVKVDVRVLSATHRDLKARIAAGQFREDLYYRLKVLDVVVPPLRQRAGDTPVLVAHFLRRFSSPGHEPELTARAWAAISGYDFPGNVRELEHAIQHAVVLAGDDEIDLMHLPTELLGAIEPEVAEAGGFMPLTSAVREFEREYLRRALALADGNKTRAARLLGISRKNLWEKLRSFEVADQLEVM